VTIGTFEIPGDAALIAFCGVDGSGKTTQLTLLGDRLAESREVFRTKQPTPAFRNDPLIRAYLEDTMDRDDPELSAEIGPEVGLFAAANRYRHLRTEVMPQLRAGRVVLTDRYVFTCYAYTEPRGFAPLDWVQEINRYVPYPDLTFFFDVPPAVSLARIRGRGDTPKWEELNSARIAAIEDQFREQPWGEVPGYHVLDGTLPVDQLHAIILELTNDMLGRKNLPPITIGGSLTAAPR